MKIVTFAGVRSISEKLKTSLEEIKNTPSKD